MMKTTIFLGMMFLLAAYSTLVSARSVNFEDGSKTVWSADFADWKRDRDEYGYRRPHRGKYVVEAYGDTLVGSGLEPITRLTNDFIIDVAFKFEDRTGEPFLEVMLSDTGHEPSRLHFRLWIFDSGEAEFSIEETWLENDSRAKRIRDYAAGDSVPEDYLSNVRWHRTNRLSIKREGRRVRLYLNGHLLKSFRPSHFNIGKLGIVVAGESELHITSVRARVPK